MNSTMAEGLSFAFTDQDFEWLRSAANRYSGIQLPDSKRQMIYSRLAKRLRQLGLGSFAEYRSQLGDAAEFGEFINCLTTNVTSFLREPHHFEHLKAVALPERVNRREQAPGPARRIRIWSAGCSTGEEPYSISGTAVAWLGQHARNWDFRLLATDLDTNVLDRARAGVYPLASVESLDAEFRRRCFLKGRDEFSDSVRVKPVFQAPIEFRQWNLVKPWAPPEPMDIIFCRNVVIYFDKPTQRTLFNRFADTLLPGGYLYIGHSETLFQICDRFELVAKTTYRKIG